MTGGDRLALRTLAILPRALALTLGAGVAWLAFKALARGVRTWR